MKMCRDSSVIHGERCLAQLPPSAPPFFWQCTEFVLAALKVVTTADLTQAMRMICDARDSSKAL